MAYYYFTFVISMGVFEWYEEEGGKGILPSLAHHSSPSIF
jgi:hypothetical protein